MASTMPQYLPSRGLGRCSFGTGTPGHADLIILPSGLSHRAVSVIDTSRFACVVLRQSGSTSSDFQCIDKYVDC